MKLNRVGLQTFHRAIFRANYFQNLFLDYRSIIIQLHEISSGEYKVISRFGVGAGFQLPLVDAPKISLKPLYQWSNGRENSSEFFSKRKTNRS